MAQPKRTAARSSETRRRVSRKPPKVRQVSLGSIPRGSITPENGRFSRTGWLAGILRERILDGTYQPGERIREVQLRSEFGFSNGPIREALQAVVADGLAERAPWHGVRVKKLSESELIELFHVRLALLEYAAELAARRRSAALTASGKALKKEFDTAFNAYDVPDHHPSFNGRLSQWLLASAGNKALHELWDKTMQQTLIYVNASLERSHGRKSRVLVNQLIDAICKGDIEAARIAARTLTKQTVVDLGITGPF
jgi:DNA-binding GntR family transcriptional regulator